MASPKKDQLCFRITGFAYRELYDVMTFLKTSQSHAWTNSALLNVLIRKHVAQYKNISDKKQRALLKEYESWREDK